MPRKKYTPEEIVAKLRQVDVLVSQGQTMADAIRQIGVSEVTFYRSPKRKPHKGEYDRSKRSRRHQEEAVARRFAASSSAACQRLSQRQEPLHIISLRLANWRWLWRRCRTILLVLGEDRFESFL